MSQMWGAAVTYPFFYGQASASPLDHHGSLSLWRMYGCEDAGFLTNAIQLTTGDHSVQGFIYGFYNRVLTHEDICH